MHQTGHFHTFAERLFKSHPTRMWRREKDAFLSHCTSEFKTLGYDEGEITVRQDKNALGLISHNLVVGKADADILITAHYDTPGRNGFLLFLNPIFGGALGSILLMVALMLLVRLPDAYFVQNAISGTRLDLVFFILNAVIALLFFGSFFLKNKRNHNDNTSGVIAVFRAAELIAAHPELRARVAFVLFDHEEILPGLLGSRAFSKWRRNHHPAKADGLVINLDCVGVGDVLTVMTKHKHEDWHQISDFMQGKGFQVKKVRGGLAGTSDHAVFSKGVSFLFQKRALLGPLYIPHIHSGRDRHCDLDQIDQLCTATIAYLQTS